MRVLEFDWLILWFSRARGGAPECLVESHILSGWRPHAQYKPRRPIDSSTHGDRLMTLQKSEVGPWARRHLRCTTATWPDLPQAPHKELYWKNQQNHRFLRILGCRDRVRKMRSGIARIISLRKWTFQNRSKKSIGSDFFVSTSFSHQTHTSLAKIR